MANLEIAVPPDVIYEILTFLPVKSLLKFKIVSKSWHAVISSQSFGRALSERSRKLSLNTAIVTMEIMPDGGESLCMYVYKGNDENKYDIARCGLYLQQFVGNAVCYSPPQHSNGLLLLKTKTSLTVCNPGTRESLTLPGTKSAFVDRWFGNRWSRLPFMTACLGFVPSINAHKVGRFFPRSVEKLDIGFEVFTIGRDSSWRVVEEDPPYLILVKRPSSVGEVIYFRVEDWSHKGSSKAFLAFNLCSEKFTTVEPPPPLSVADCEDRARIVNLDGYPCLSYRSEDYMKYELWVSRDFDDHAWIPHTSITLLQPITALLPLSFSTGKLLLWSLRHRGLVYYDAEGKSFDLLVDPEDHVAFFKRLKCGHRRSYYKAGVKYEAVSYTESLTALSYTTTKMVIGDQTQWLKKIRYSGIRILRLLIWSLKQSW